MRRLLIADTPENLPLQQRALSGHFDCYYALTIKEACFAAREWNPELLIVGSSFDNFRMCELLSLVRSCGNSARLPALAVQDSSILRACVHKNIETIFEPCTLIDINFGDPQAETLLRRAVLDCVLVDMATCSLIEVLSQKASY